MNDPRPVREIGRSGRAHGVRGELRVELLTDRDERLAVGAQIRIAEQWYTIRGRRRADRHWLVALDGVDDRTAAERLAQQAVYADADDSSTDDDALWVHELIGRRVIDQHGIDRGECVAVIDNPADDLLELDGGALVPVGFIERLEGEWIVVDAPEGLFELSE